MLQAFALATSATRTAHLLLRKTTYVDLNVSRKGLRVSTVPFGSIKGAAHLYTPTQGYPFSPLTALQVVEEQRTMSALVGIGDIYDGIAVSPEHLPDDPDDFADRLRTSLQEWSHTQRKGIWLKLPLSHAKLVPVAIAQDFVPHHAERDYIMLTKWLADSEDKLPANPSHQVGVGAFVFDKTSQKVLMVQEKNGPLKGTGVWKMPTGLLLAREDIGTAAEREVLEETGVRASFKSVLAIRQAHTALWNKSDMFIVLALEPVAGQTDILIQDDELDGAEWQTLEQFENSPFQKQYPLLGRIQERCAAYARGAYKGLDAVKFPHRNSEQLLVFGSEGCEESAKL